LAVSDLGKGEREKGKQKRGRVDRGKGKAEKGSCLLVFHFSRNRDIRSFYTFFTG